MYDNLLKIYQSKLIQNPSDFNKDKYYYFYGQDGKLFGIEKTITVNEYKLLKTFYLEKVIEHMDSKSESIYKYIFENGKYPFLKKYKFIVVNNNIDSELLSLLNEIFINLEVLQLDKISLLFFEDDGFSDISVVFQTISDDFGKQLFIHEGLVLNKNIKGSIVAHYIGVLLNTNCFNKDYSNLIDLLLSGESNVIYSLMKELKESYFNPILNKNNTKTVLDVFFKNDLNVSKTAKDLYLNRNSLINRLDSFSKEVGYNVQSFKFATIMLLIMNLR